MKIRITLSGQGGLLDKQVIDVDDDYNDADISNAIRHAMECWVLAPGDAIHILKQE